MSGDRIEDLMETTTDGDDDMREVDEIILNASKELEKVAEENKKLLEIFEKTPRSPKKAKREEEESKNEKKVIEKNVIKQLEIAEQQAKDTANKIYDLKTRVGELLRKKDLTENETKELERKNRELKEKMLLFEEQTRKIQNLIEKSNLIPVSPPNGKMQKNVSPRSSTPFSKTEDDSPRSLKEKLKNNNKSGSCSCCSEHIRQNGVPTFAKKLCQSYTMQEKLAAENADLESVRYKLQEELLNKDQTVENLQKELGNLQSEMRMISRENNVLNEKLKKLQEMNVGSVKSKKSSKKTSKHTLQEYSDNTYQLEKQLTDMENDVKCLHEEISSVQKEREHLEMHRKMMCSRPSYSAFSPHLKMTPQPYSPRLLQKQTMRKINENYEKLENDLKAKINDLNILKSDYEKLRKLTEDAEHFKKVTEEKIKEIEKLTKNPQPEIEQKLMNAKKRFMKAQDALNEQRQMIKEQKNLVEKMKFKFLDVKKQLEEQKNSKISSENEIFPGNQHVSREKLEEMIA